jgi:hypothetical protein
MNWDLLGVDILEIYIMKYLMTITGYGSPLLTLCIGGLLTLSRALRHIICV